MIECPSMGSRVFIGLTLAVLSVAGFASTFIFGAELTKECGVSPSVLSFLRFAIALAVLLPCSCRSKRGLRESLRPRDLITLAWLGPVGTTLMAWCVFMGCARVSAANASMADALTPLMIFVVAAIRTRHVPLSGLASLICGLIGAVLVVQIVTTEGLQLSAYSTGDVFILLAAATWGFYTVYGREPIRRLGSSRFTLITMAAGVVALGAVLPFADAVWPQTTKAWLLVLALGLVSTLMPFWAWNAAQKYISMSALGISAYFTPVFAVALALVFLGEVATPLQWTGTAFVVLSGFLEARRS